MPHWRLVDAVDAGVPLDTAYDQRSAERAIDMPERVRLNRQRGVIRVYHAEIGPAALNRSVEAFDSAQISPLCRDVIETFKAALIDLPAVVAVLVKAGNEDFLIQVARSRSSST
jgi:DNA-binding Lrp family transcriptional regulator